MTITQTPGAKFRAALKNENPLQIIGTVNAYCALMAKRVGFQANYLSGGAVASMSYGVPDLGITSLENVLADVQRITSVCDVPLLVDIDTGWGSELNIAHTIAQMIKAGAAAVHMEDQVAAKRCGHRPKKELVSTNEMVQRIKAACEAKTDPDFYIIARTDAADVESLESAIERAKSYVAAGADAIFAEALTDLDQYRDFVNAIDAPILANITEFGKTPLLSVDELHNVGVRMVLFPWAATRAMNAAALNVYQQVRKHGTQKELIDSMQDRETLYDYLNYYEYENKLNRSE